MDSHGQDLVWLHGEVKTPPFSSDARVEAGILLRKLQMGEKLSLPQSSPVSRIGSGCHELRIRDREASWRIFYFIDTDAIVILEVFEKKTKDIPSAVIQNCQRRLRLYKAAK